jgi:hypothetical protein
MAPVTVTDEALRVGWKEDHAAAEDVLGRKTGHVVLPEDRLPIVTEWSGMSDWVNCPPDYDTWARQYLSYTENRVRHFGAWDEIEDIVQTIMARFAERDSLGVFTPEWGSQSNTGKSNFRSYYSRFILTYVISQRRNYTRMRKRQCLIFNAPVGDDGKEWGEVKAPVVDADTVSAEFNDLAARLRREVKDDRLVDVVLELARDSQPIKLSELRRDLGLSHGAAKSGLEKVRTALRSLQAAGMLD